MIENFKKDIDKGLSSYPKSLPSKYLYDKKGDDLFIKIMGLSEYYLTRSELEIFRTQTENIVDTFQLDPTTYFELIEFGVGNGLKTKEILHLLDKKKYTFDYFPIDISLHTLDKLGAKINNEFPDISIKKKHGDYFEILSSLKDSHHLKIVLFLGSNIGNMTDEIAAEFMGKLSAYLSSGDKLFLGVDLIKPASIVLPAYNDTKGVTKEFNLNLLQRINTECNADFNINKFYHQPEYSEQDGVAKSYLISSVEQEVTIKEIGKTYRFSKDEKILTEISRKYNDHIITKIISNTGFKITDKLCDSKKYFCNYVLTKE